MGINIANKISNMIGRDKRLESKIRELESQVRALEHEIDIAVDIFMHLSKQESLQDNHMVMMQLSEALSMFPESMERLDRLYSGRA